MTIIVIAVGSSSTYLTFPDAVPPITSSVELVRSRLILTAWALEKDVRPFGMERLLVQEEATHN